MSGNFGPLPVGAQILWQTPGVMLMYADAKGGIWRYLYDYHARWPVEFNPPIDVKRHIQQEPAANIKHGLTEKEIEDLI